MLCVDAIFYLLKIIYKSVNSQMEEAIASFFKAADQGDIDSLNRILSEIQREISPKKIPEFVSHQFPNGKTALHAACHRGFEDVAELLVNNGAVLDIMDSDGKTPLHLAAERDFLDVVRCLVESGAVLEAKDVSFLFKKLAPHRFSLLVNLVTLTSQIT